MAFGFHNMRGIFLQAEQLYVFQEGLFSMESHLDHQSSLFLS